MAKEKTTPETIETENTATEETAQKEETVTMKREELDAILERLARLEEKKPDAKGSKADSANGEKAEKNRKMLTEKVTRRLFYDGSDKYKDDVFVCVNGKNMLIKRGKDVEIPKAFAEVLDNASIQAQKAADLEEELSKEANW